MNMTNHDQKQTCCPEFNPEPWDGKIFNWQDRKFIKDSVFTFFFMPINFGQVMRKLDKKVTAVGAEIPDFLCLSDHTSRWNMDVYLAVDREIPGGKNINLNGKFLSKVYEGLFRDTGKWCRDFETYAANQNLKIKKWYMWYTTCPKCAKKYGENYVVIISEVE